MEQTDLRYLKSLAKQYPTVAAAATEIINLPHTVSWRTFADLISSIA